MPKDLKDFEPGNHWIAALLKIPVGSDLMENLRTNQAYAKQMKGSYKLLATVAMAEILLLLPYNLC